MAEFSIRTAAGMIVRVNSAPEEASGLLDVVDAGVVPSDLLPDAFRFDSDGSAYDLEYPFRTQRFIVLPKDVLHGFGGAEKFPAFFFVLLEFLAVLGPAGKYRYCHQDGDCDEDDFLLGYSCLFVL